MSALKEFLDAHGTTKPAPRPQATTGNQLSKLNPSPGETGESAVHITSTRPVRREQK